MKLPYTITSIVFSLAVLSVSPAVAMEVNTAKAQLGEIIFFDVNLSRNRNQACASCHDPATGWSGPDSHINATGAAYEGSIKNRFGNRKPPTAAYASFNPVLHVITDEDNLFVGGNFWDGRATGENLGSPVADQAQGPFLNPLEHALPNSACVVHRVCTSAYATEFKKLWPKACNINWPDTVIRHCSTADDNITLDANTQAKVDYSYDAIALTIAEFEASTKLNSFTSKYDYYLMGKAKLSAQERQGLDLFNNKGKCADCHPSTSSVAGVPPLFTDFTYDNLGLPRNPDNPFYKQDSFNPQGEQWIDTGLGGFLATRHEWKQFAKANMGKHKVPTLRNVDKRPQPAFVKTFGHNGYFKSLKEFVHFYNTRDRLPHCEHGHPDEKISCWPAAEVTENVNRSELGDLKLTPAEEDAIVAFMKTLSDGYQPGN